MAWEAEAAIKEEPTDDLNTTNDEPLRVATTHRHGDVACK